MSILSLFLWLLNKNNEAKYSILIYLVSCNSPFRVSRKLRGSFKSSKRSSMPHLTNTDDTRLINASFWLSTNRPFKLSIFTIKIKLQQILTGHRTLVYKYYIMYSRYTIKISYENLQYNY